MRKRKLRVYVAGPITIGNQFHNVKRAIDVTDDLLQLGYLPFCPHFTVYWDTIHPHSRDTWLRYDLGWLPLCDALVMIPGKSDGSDREVNAAREHNIPVVYLPESLDLSILRKKLVDLLEPSDHDSPTTSIA